MPSIKVYNLRRDKNIPLDAVYVGRGTKWGNPYIRGRDGTKEQVIEKFKHFVLPDLDVRELKGKSLICFCAPSACHADLILKKANGGKIEKQSTRNKNRKQQRRSSVSNHRSKL